MLPVFIYAFLLENARIGCHFLSYNTIWFFKMANFLNRGIELNAGIT